jgi:hypothetical protein
MDRSSTTLSRRNFLLAISAGGAATAAAVAAKVVPQAQPATTGADPSKGYQETPHIRNYYRTTQV